MTIKVYSSIMPGDPEEVYHDHGMTVEDWVKSRTPDYSRGSVQPISCMINGAIVDPVDWCDAIIHEKDCVEFRVVPRSDAISWIGAAFFPVFAGNLAAVGVDIGSLFAADIPDGSRSGQQGSDISVANAKANVARLGQSVPEVLGRYIRYPDYLNQPHRRYSDTRTQVLHLMLCVGKGEYEIDEGLIKIGESPVNSLGQSVNYQIFEPGEDVSGHIAHENWYNAPEVGGTTGSAGIRLKSAPIFIQQMSVNQIDFEDDLITVPYGAGTVPGDWDVGMRMIVFQPKSITVVNSGQDSDGNYLPDILEGEFRDFEPGDLVTVGGGSDIDGDYIIDTINSSQDEITLLNTDLTPAAFLPAGTYDADVDYTGVRYQIEDILTEQIQVGTEEVENPDPPPATIEQPIYETRRLGFEVTRLLSDGSEDPSWPGFETASYANAVIVLDTSGLEGDWSGPFYACPEGEVTSTIEWDIFAPQGLATVEDDGDLRSRNRTVQLQWREEGDLMWNTVSEGVGGRTRDQLGWTFTVNLPSAIRPQVRVRRTSAESTSTQAMDRLEWYGLRTRLPTVSSYPEVTTMAITIEGSDTIASRSENQINLVPVRKLPPVSGGDENQTRSIARAAAYVARSLGYDDDQIDVDEFERYEDIWLARGDTFDYVFSDTTAKRAIDTILRAGFAEMTIDNGLITPVRDEPRTQLEEGYSPENMTAPLRRNFTAKQPEEADGVEVEFTKAGTWTEETVKCYLPGDQGFKLDKIKLEGVTDETRAWRIGMRRRRAQRYRRWAYNFETELDALNSSYMSYVPLLDDIPGYGKVAILVGIEEDRITVSEPLEWKDGETHVVAYRDEEGETVGPFAATKGADDYTVMVEIPQPWPAVLPSDREPTHIYFGTTDRWSFPALITEINPSSPLRVSVSATNYDERVYTDDSNTPS